MLNTQGVFGMQENVFIENMFLLSQKCLWYVGKCILRKYLFTLIEMFVYNLGNTVKSGSGGNQWWVRSGEEQSVTYDLFSLLPLEKLFSNLFFYRKCFPKCFTNQARENFLENGFLHTKYPPRMRSRSLMRVLPLALDLSDIMYL